MLHVQRSTLKVSDEADQQALLLIVVLFFVDLS